LGPILFIIYINDLVEHVNYGSDLYLYADDAKLFSFIKTMEDSAMLQKDLDSLAQRMKTWLLRLNIGKCKVISYSRRPEVITNYSISGVTVENIENSKDLGVTFDNNTNIFFSERVINGKYTQFELPGKFMKVTYNDSLSDKSM